MHTRTVIAALLGFARPHFAIDPSEPAIDQALAPAAPDAAAAPASDAGESNTDAPAAAAGPESDTSSSAALALRSGGTAVEGAPQGDAPEVAASGEGDSDARAEAGANSSLSQSSETVAEDGSQVAADTGNAASDPTPAVSIDVEDHAEACERFAGLMATLHNAEADFVHALRNELNAIGALLHLHSVASGKADATGDYSSSDLS
ncbi:hypothetical protein [Burkholderia stabilis]|uniref:Uncharacterized protein n=1 Tax=Burkholderia stabilis TaxID=95485 RepID=A0AAJ5NCD5_9BURK|nr:hypothetical protein [Burkholderia stabilis]VBB13400.1 hypothetical protein BSTAB16_3585 [Burkholderia stabilis]